VEFIDNCIDVIYSFDSQMRRKFLIIYGVILLFLILGLHGIFFFKNKAIEQKKRLLEERRLFVQKIITKKKDIEKKKQRIEDILKKDPHFRIKEYLQSYVEQAGLMQYFVVESQSFSENSLRKDFSELTVSFEIKGITSNQMVTILSSIEADERVYLKEIEIKNRPDERLCDISLLLATVKIASPM